MSFLWAGRELSVELSNRVATELDHVPVVVLTRIDEDPIDGRELDGGANEGPLSLHNSITLSTRYATEFCICASSVVGSRT